MNRIAIPIALALVALGMSSFALEARACFGAPHRTPYQEYQAASVVFVGKATGQKEVAVREENAGKTYTWQDRVFEFAVEKSLKGPKSPRFEIRLSRPDCDWGINVGDTYLIYAFGDPGKKLVTSMFYGRT